jgi:histidinol-phosphate aminotransferase
MLINLQSNENPFSPPQNVVEAAKKGLKNINRYSEMEYLNDLKQLLAGYNNISPQRITLSPGSDLLLRDIIDTFSKNRKIITINPSFFSISHHALKFAKKLIKIQLVPQNFALKPELILSELNDPTLIILDNPNNPTGGILLDEDLIENILQNPNALLVIDEAYFEFSKQTFAGLIEQYPNLAILRTMDKAFSLAGLRLGYLLTGDFFRNHFSDFPKFLPAPTLLAGIEALRNPEYVFENVEKIIAERERVKEELQKSGIKVFSSKGNFLLIKSNAPDFEEKIVTNGILIKSLSEEWLSDFYRVSIGLPKENDTFLKAFS